jgi:hypothetical protein
MHACRSGYACNNLGDPTTHMGAFANGFCLPIDCSMPGAMCPAGSHCVMTNGDGGMTASGVCVM